MPAPSRAGASASISALPSLHLSSRPAPAAGGKGKDRGAVGLLPAQSPLPAQASGASAGKSPIPFLDPWSQRALPPPLQPFLQCFPRLITMFLHYSTITIAGVRAGTASPYPQGHQRAAVHPQGWKEFQKETNRHLRVERISP